MATTLQNTTTPLPGRPPIRTTPIEDDSHTGRNWVIRWLMVPVWLSLFVGGGVAIGHTIAWSLSNAVGGAWFWQFVLGWTGALIGGYFFADFFAKRLTKTVPRNQALVTTDYIASKWFGSESEGAMVPYGPGFHISSAFENADEDSNFSLELITLTFTEAIPTDKSSQVIASVATQVRVSLPRLRRVTQINDSTLQKGLVGQIKGSISGYLGNKTANEAITQVVETSQYLTRSFGITHDDMSDDEPTDFEIEYGMDIIAIIVTGIDLPGHVQEARDANDKLEQIIKLVARLAGYRTPEDVMDALKNGTLSTRDYNRYIQQALIASKSAEGRINIHDIQQDPGASQTTAGAAVVASAIGGAQGGNP